MAVGPVHTLLGLYMGIQRMRVSLVRVQPLRHSQPDLLSSDTAQSIGKPMAPPTRGEIFLSGLVFTYPGNDSPTLDSTSGRLPAGSKVGIYGASGTGKTTLVDLLLRHFDPQHRVIEIDGTDLRKMDLQAWRKRVAVVAQDIVLFHASLRDNIRYARLDASEDKVLATLRLARLQGWVDTLPQSLDTLIGERGMNISAGQRQRIALALALLQDPVLVILDEATSAVDAEDERAMMAVIDDRLSQCTRLVISHRDAPLADLDMLLTIVQGPLHLRPAVGT